VYLCYMDESGTSALPGNTSHFVLAGLCIPISKWRTYERQIETIKSKFDLLQCEIHTGWILRPYVEQNKIASFANMSRTDRRVQVETHRKGELLRLQKTNRALYKQTCKNYRHTEPYVHLTFQERMNLMETVAGAIGSWSDARLFAECIDKVHFNPTKAKMSADEQAFEQIVSRFERFLRNLKGTKTYGLLIRDNNETVSRRYTELMKVFHASGTVFTGITHIIETPLFVSSALTSMVQMADVCAYALRRYLENKEKALLQHVFKGADRNRGVVVGVRHFTVPSCDCSMCMSHRKT